MLGIAVSVVFEMFIALFPDSIVETETRAMLVIGVVVAAMAVVLLALPLLFAKSPKARIKAFVMTLIAMATLIGIAFVVTRVMLAIVGMFA